MIILSDFGYERLKAAAKRFEDLEKEQDVYLRVARQSGLLGYLLTMLKKEIEVRND